MTSRPGARAFGVLLAMAVVAGGCGSSGPAPAGPVSVNGHGVVESTAFGDGDAMPARITCDGAGLSPPLRWAAPDGAPEGLDYAILVVDVDASGGDFVHWLVYGLARSGSILEGGPVPGPEGRNSFGDDGYGGPCPPPGDGPHRYEVRLYALRAPPTPPPSGLSVDDLLGGVPDGAGLATLIGTYGRD